MLFSQLTAQQRKDIKALHRKAIRDEHQEFLAEGLKVCKELLSSQYRADCIVVTHDAGDDVIDIAQAFYERGVPVFSAHADHFRSMSDAQSPQDILAVVNYSASHIPILDDTIIILDSVADPGNVGTIIRTADWFGIKTIIMGAGCADRYNPKVVRSTMGSLFHCDIIQAHDIPAFVQSYLPDYCIAGAMLSGNSSPSLLRQHTKLAIVFGNESAGISPSVESILTHTYHIPGSGKAESLNVAIAAAISMYVCKS